MTERTGRPPSPFRLDLEEQRNRAKELLSAAQAADPEALSRFAAAGRMGSRSSPERFAATVQLTDAQHVIARELRFARWASRRTSGRWSASGRSSRRDVVRRLTVR